MERSNDGAYGRTPNFPSGRAVEGRASAESQGPRLQKKRSQHRMRQDVRNASQPLPAVQGYSRAGSITEQARKGSLRNVVRRIFGRRSRELEAPPQQRSPPRHQYTYSEPAANALLSQEERTSLGGQYGDLPHRTFSAPLSAHPPSPVLQRAKSPYAVEFPQSARLKPVNLGNPYDAPGSTLRRRRTMPNVLGADTDDKPATEPPVPSFEPGRDAPLPEVDRVRTSVNPKRRSRSADDLQRGLEGHGPKRSAGEELRFWRDSFQGSVLRASGFMSMSPVFSDVEERVEDRTPTAAMEDPFTSSQPSTVALLSSPRGRHGPSGSETEVRSMGTYGTELSKDLEDRVAKLEAGLLSFQQSLARMTAERNRRTVMIGDVSPRRSSIEYARTPSMLADTLSGHGAWASIQYAATAPRPATSPQPPRTPVRSSSAHRPPVPPLPTGDALAERPVTPPAAGVPQPYTFRSLYEMLADERAARRRLESQIRGLRQDIDTLQYQVSAGSQSQSQLGSGRESFVPPDPHAGSSRLTREVLQHVPSSPPGSSEAQRRMLQRLDIRDSAGTGFTSISGQAGMVSRFSRSDSEAAVEGDGDDEEALQTPYEAYQTPIEERAPSPFRSTHSLASEGEMF